jgi:hypothetical protein
MSRFWQFLVSDFLLKIYILLKPALDHIPMPRLEDSRATVTEHSLYPKGRGHNFSGVPSRRGK